MKMRPVIILALLIVMCTALTACGSPQKYMLSKEDIQKEQAKEETGLSNPATLYCLNQTGTSWEIRENEAGQYGICIFPDGSWCEEWAFYRGSCSPGMNITSCERQSRGKTMCPPTYDPVCGKLTSGGWKTFSNKCSACSSDENITGYVPGECE